ncbi:MAG: ChaN family lipoprotein [Acidobacteria bacterium]|nr:ChaN family lipoprotein [Acidobacteriota bacterium]
MHRLRLAIKLTGWITAGALVVAGGFYLFENRAPSYRVLSQAETAEFVAALRAHGEPPATYVLHRFTEHPVVLLGEPHRVREHYEFLIGLLPQLPGAGVHQVAIELFRQSSQSAIDRLLAGAAFDERLARRIVFSAAPYFYYEELYEVLQKAWEVNRGSQRLSIIGIWGVNDSVGAEVINRAVSERGKMLVYTGTHHAFTSYYEPGLEASKGPRRIGHHLKVRFNRSPFFIKLHYPEAKRHFFRVPILLYRQAFCLPFGGVLDQAFQAHVTPVGFDTSHQEFDGVIERFSYYAQGHPELRLRQYCDGYVYLGPVSRQRFVRPLHGIAASEEDREVLRAVLGEERQARMFGSERDAVRVLQRDGFNTPERMRAHTDLRGVEEVLPR